MELPQALARHARRSGHRDAIVERATRVSYSELWSSVERCASQLAQREGPVGIRCSSLQGTVVGVLAALHAGRAFVPLDVRDSVIRTHQLLFDASVVDILNDTPDPPDEVLDRPDVDATAGVAKSVAYIMFTSGSTGSPKMIRHTRGTLEAVGDNFVSRIGLRSGEGLGVAASLAHDAVLVDIAAAMVAGATMVRLEVGDARLWRRPADWLRRRRVQVVHCVPTFARRLVQRIPEPGDLDTTGIRAWVFGGEATTADLLRDVARRTPAAEINLLYGQTECSIVSICRATGVGDAASLGAPVEGVEWSVAPVSEGSPELLISGSLVSPDARAADVHACGREQWFATGDSVRPTPEGLFFAGRTDDQVKLRGERISLGEVESVLRSHDCVRDAAVLVLDSVQLVGLVDCEEDARVGIVELNDLLGSALGSWAFLSRVVRLDGGLPTLPSGKLDRQLMRHLAERGG